MAIKRPKIIYNNKNVVLGIKQYIIEYIKNLDKILADLEQTDIIIARAKSQFC